MLIQSLFLMATIVVLGGALLTSALVSARAAFHQTVLQKSHVAMSDATARFATWAQDQVIKYGTEQGWPTQAEPTNPDKTAGVTVPICDAVTSPTPDAPGQQNCSMLATMKWNVTGWSAPGANGSPDRQGSSTATNLSTTLKEQRISATITVTITNANSNTIVATHSREATARIFDAYPYVAITALRDASSESATTASLEGDTGGYAITVLNPENVTSPTKSRPAYAVDTTIRASIDCINSPLNNNQQNPMLDQQASSFSRDRNIGNVAWIYEAPCKPTYASRISTVGAPTNYHQAVGNVYTDNTELEKTPWIKSKKVSGFSR